MLLTEQMKIWQSMWPFDIEKREQREEVMDEGGFTCFRKV